MAEAATRIPAKQEGNGPEAGRTVARGEPWPFARLRDGVDRLFDDFAVDPWRSPFRRAVFDVEPFWRGDISRGKTPAVDIAEIEKAFEITAELPGIEEKNVEVKYADGTLTIKGEKKDEKEEKEEKKENHYLRRRARRRRKPTRSSRTPPPPWGATCVPTMCTTSCCATSTTRAGTTSRPAA
jgi:HSP20 family protein